MKNLFQVAAMAVTMTGSGLAFADSSPTIPSGQQASSFNFVIKTQRPNGCTFEQTKQPSPISSAAVLTTDHQFRESRYYAGDVVLATAQLPTLVDKDGHVFHDLQRDLTSTNARDVDTLVALSTGLSDDTARELAADLRQRCNPIKAQPG